MIPTTTFGFLIDVITFCLTNVIDSFYLTFPLQSIRESM